MDNFIIKGNICYSVSAKNMIIRENGFLICAEGKSRGVYQEITAKYVNGKKIV